MRSRQRGSRRPARRSAASRYVEHMAVGAIFALTHARLEAAVVRHRVVRSGWLVHCDASWFSATRNRRIERTSSHASRACGRSRQIASLCTIAQSGRGIEQRRSSDRAGVRVGALLGALSAAPRAARALRRSQRRSVATSASAGLASSAQLSHLSHGISATVSLAWRLTPPSSGRPKGRFAPFAPPLMSNVRSHCADECCSRFCCLVLLLGRRVRCSLEGLLAAASFFAANRQWHPHDRLS